MSLPASPASPLSLAGLGEESNIAVDEEVVAAFDSLMIAELVRGRLEASGIAARLEDANTVSVASHLALAIGGVKVVVARSDLDAARTLINTPSPLAQLDDVDERPTAPEPSVDRNAGWSLRFAVFGMLVPVVGQIGSFAFAVNAFASWGQLS